jgi:ubiquinone/menaquinone biosynthesis C-methylase UbiE
MVTAPRIKKSYLDMYGDNIITDWVLKYYEIFDTLDQAQGGLQLNIREVYRVKNYMQDRKFGKFLEIGVCDGGSLWLYSQLFCKPSAEIIGIDINEKPCAVKVVSALGRNFDSAAYIIANADEIVDTFQDNYFDLIHIDANHTYKELKKNFDNYIPKLTDFGIMLLHDTNARNNPEPRAFVDNEVLPFYNCKQFDELGYAASSYENSPETLITGTTLIQRKG